MSNNENDLDPDMWDLVSRKLKLTQGGFIDCVIKKVRITKKHLEYLEKEITIMNCLSNLKLKHQIQLYGVIFGQKYISILMEKTKADPYVAKYISQDLQVLDTLNKRIV